MRDTSVNEAQERRERNQPKRRFEDLKPTAHKTLLLLQHATKNKKVCSCSLKKMPFADNSYQEVHEKDLVLSPHQVEDLLSVLYPFENSGTTNRKSWQIDFGQCALNRSPILPCLRLPSWRLDCLQLYHYSPKHGLRSNAMSLGRISWRV